MNREGHPLGFQFLFSFSKFCLGLFLVKVTVLGIRQVDA